VVPTFLENLWTPDDNSMNRGHDMYKASTSPFSSQNLHYQVEYHITARTLPHQVVCCPKECSVGRLSLRINFDLGFFNFLRLDIYI